jgi:hypothetical protein
VVTGPQHTRGAQVVSEVLDAGEPDLPRQLIDPEVEWLGERYGVEYVGPVAAVASLARLRRYRPAPEE